MPALGVGESVGTDRRTDRTDHPFTISLGVSAVTFAGPMVFLSQLILLAHGLRYMLQTAPGSVHCENMGHPSRREC